MSLAPQIKRAVGIIHDLSTTKYCSNKPSRQRYTFTIATTSVLSAVVTKQCRSKGNISGGGGGGHAIARGASR